MSPPSRSPRRPSTIVAVDANILLSAVLDRGSLSLFGQVVEACTIITSARAADGVRGVLSARPNRAAGALARAEALLASILVIENAAYEGFKEVAAHVLTYAVASRNGSAADAHLLACAWAFDADIWSHDRDFAGTGWPSWSNANLREAIEGSRDAAPG